MSYAVLGGEVSFAPRVVLPLAAFHLLAAAAVLRADRAQPGRGRTIARLVVLALVAGLAARTVLGVVWAFGAGDGGRAFFWLNLLLYTPLCLALLLADLGIVRHGATRAWPRRTAVIVPVLLATVVSAVAYEYQPPEQPRTAPTADSAYVETPVARFHYLRRGSGSPVVLLAPSGLAERDPWTWEALKLPVAGEVLAKLGTSRSAVEGSVRGLFVNSDRVTAELVDEMWTAATFAGNVRALYALEPGLDWVTQAALPATRQPALVIRGAQDTVLSVAQAARFDELLPSATTHVLDGCGHAFTLDCPDRVTPLLEDFLA